MVVKKKKRISGMLQKFRKSSLHSLHRVSPYCHYCGVLTILHKDMHRYSKGYENWHRLATLDHKLAQANGGKDVHENYVLACHKCNNEKSNRYTYRAFLTLKRQK